MKEAAVPSRFNSAMNSVKHRGPFTIESSGSKGPKDPEETLVFFRGQLIHKRWDHQDEKASYSKTFSKYGTFSWSD